MKPTIYCRTSYLDACNQLPDSIRKKAHKALKIFEREPTSNGLNYEKLEGGKDQKIFSIRVDDAYRIILARAPDEPIYMACWVGNHDDSYNWAKNRILTVHPLSGEIQIIETLETAAPVAKSPESASESSEIAVRDIFEYLTDADLRQLGATDDTLRLIRSITDDHGLEKLERRFTEPVFDALLRLACGDPYDVVLEDVGIETGKKYATDDFKTALELDVNKQRFAVITDDSELERILSEPLAHWRVFLHPSQRKLVDANFNGPARVLGGAGTGKTVVAMHRAKYLASQCIENEQILFTTFTKSLIHDIKHNLQKLCTYDEISRIKVVHLDAWCANFLQNRNSIRDIAYREDHPLRNKLWKQSLDAVNVGEFTAEFLRSEWDKVIQYHDVTDFPSYAGLPRPGRHERLDRLQRKAIWPVFQKFRSLLNEHQLWEPADMFRAARSILVNEGLEAGFKHIIVDEIQDFHPQAFRLLRAMIPTVRYLRNDLFLVGDGHQNIYGHKIILSQLGIDIRGRGRRLKLNYRTPEEIRRWAVAVLQGQEIDDLDGGKDTNKGYHSSMKGPEPVFESFQSFEDEVQHIATWYRHIRESNGSHVACVTVHTNAERQQYANALTQHGCPVLEITGESMDIDDPAPLRLTTMHRIKGLEFDHVCLADCHQLNLANLPVDRQNSGRCLLHVAATRTKNSLLIIHRK